MFPHPQTVTQWASLLVWEPRAGGGDLQGSTSHSLVLDQPQATWVRLLDTQGLGLSLPPFSPLSQTLPLQHLQGVQGTLKLEERRSGAPSGPRGWGLTPSPGSVPSPRFPSFRTATLGLTLHVNFCFSGPSSPGVPGTQV